MFSKLQSKLIPFLLPAIFFLLPWQTRYIFAEHEIAGEPFAFGVVSLYLVEALVVLAFLLYGRLQICKVYKQAVGLLFLIICLAGISITWSMNFEVAFGQFAHLLVALMLFLLLLDSRTDLRKVMIGFAAGLIIPIGLGVWQVIVGSSGASTILGLAARDAQRLGDAVYILEDGTRILRAYGSFSHPNTFGGYLVVGILSLLAVYSERNRSIFRTLWWIFISVLLIGVLLTFSQSAWIALIISLICGTGVLWLYQKGRQSSFKILAGVFSVVILMGSIFGVLVLNRASLDQSSIVERAEQYQEWPRVVSDSIALGAGLGNYTYAVEVFDQTREWWQYQPVHNVPLLIFGELGILGLVLVIAWAGAIDKLNFQRLPKRAPIVALMMGCALLVVASLDHYLWTQWAGLALVVYVMALTARLE